MNVDRPALHGAVDIFDRRPHDIAGRRPGIGRIATEVVVGHRGPHGGRGSLAAEAGNCHRSSERVDRGIVTRLDNYSPGSGDLIGA